ncbi:MAG: transglutaminase-like domain-containing protein, partial [Anaerolineae bacterium]|nr:transglutaminase-like domain-containing protein [Anaerolineae bacterium]
LAWLLLLAYGMIFTLIYLGRLLPPPWLLIAGSGAGYFRYQWAVLFDRAASWLVAVSSGGSSQETIIFAAALGLGAWLLAAYAAWSVYRQRRPLAGLVVLALALGLNGYFGGYEEHRWFATVFAGLAALLVAVLQYANLEFGWQQRSVDYSPEIRFELLATAAGVGIILLVTSFVLPALNVRQIARAFRELAAVEQTEETLGRAFEGVRPPQGGRPGFAPGGAGVLPRAFLLGDAPELYETVVMTATVTPDHPEATHWRAASYDVYTGRGWALSTEREEPVAAGTFLALPPAAAQTTFTQTVSWLFDNRAIRYTIGLPRRFDHPVRVHWRGLSDFSRAVDPDERDTAGLPYQAVSRLGTATPNELRASDPAQLPAPILDRYTNLPADLPQRVRDLAAEVASDYDSAYDQARALESFLRQYPYSLLVSGPPAGRDPVDYFLFDLQSGYCDYYATAMAVMARSLGIPARLATGYLAQAPGPDGVQTIYQINAHAWPELYFAGYGWIEFEPTSPFPARREATAVDYGFGEAPPTPEPPPVTPPIPEPPAERLSPGWALLLMVLLAAGWLWWHRRTPASPPAVPWAYHRLLRAAGALGIATPASQTPAEMEAALQARLAAWEATPRLERLLRGVRSAVATLTALFVRHQYAPPATQAIPGTSRSASEARTLWRHVRHRLWLLRWLRRLTGEKYD